MKKILIFLGPPGSGKGTQAAIVAAKKKYRHISSGQLLRDLSANADISKQDAKMLSAMSHGRLVPDKLIFRLVFEAIRKSLSEKRGVILDGAVRSLRQAKKYQKYFSKMNLENELLVVHIGLSDKSSRFRLSHRRVCSKCGINVPFSSSNLKKKKCSECGGVLETRTDDSLSIINKRIRAQGNTVLRPIADFYDKMKILRTVDGEKTIAAVTKDILRVLKN